MRRRLIAAVWILGATVPLLMATVFLVGCCVLPFHGMMHKLLPLCEMAASAMRGGHEHEHDATPAAPAREKPDARPQIADGRLQKVVVDSPALCPLRSAVVTSASYRTFISLGATRCDRDVGLHVLVETFRV